MLAKLVNNYLTLRKEQNHDEVMKMMSNNIVIDSQKDGIFKGRGEVYRYFNECSVPSGTWNEPSYINYNTVEVTGTVNFLFFSFDVRGIFYFDEDNKIEKIIIRKL